MKRQILFLFLLTLATPLSLAAELVAPNGAKQLQTYRTSWLGNSFGGVVDGKPCWVQQDIAAMHVCPDGTIYTNVPWEEAGGNCSMYKDGKMLGAAWHTHGWGYEGGKAVAANEKYVFIALRGENENGNLVDLETWPPKGFDWHGVSRRPKSDFTKAAPFEHGKGGKGDTLQKSFLVINEVPIAEREKGYITGLWADEKKLYVSNPYKNRVEIYDTETMQKLDEWNLTPHGFFDPGQIAADKQGNLWLFHAMKNPRPGDESEMFTITRFNPKGELAQNYFGTQGLPLPEKGPFCLASDRLYVFSGSLGIMSYPLPNEDGSQIANDDPRFGILGLTYSMGIQGLAFPVLWRRGEFGDLRFGINSIKALGCDVAGNLYIAQDYSTAGGGVILESYQPTGKTRELPVAIKYPKWESDDAKNKWKDLYPTLLDAKLNWRLFGLCFIDCATLDPLDETLVYTKDEIYKIDWSKTEPGSEWSLKTLTTMDGDDWRKHVKNSGGVWTRYREPKKEYENMESELVFQISVLNSFLNQEQFRDKIAQRQKQLDELREAVKAFEKNNEKPDIDKLKEEVEKIETEIAPLTKSGIQAVKKGELKRELDKARSKLYNAYAEQGYERLLFVNDMDNRLLQVYSLGYFGADTKPIDVPNEYANGLSEMMLFAPRKVSFPLFQFLDKDDSPVQPETDVAWRLLGRKTSVAEDGKPEPSAQGWWVDTDCNVWRATETQGIRRFASSLGWGYDTMLTFPHPKEFLHVKRLRYNVKSDTLFLGGCAKVEGVEHKNQHWKPMGPVVCRYDNFLKGDNPGRTEGKLRWQVVLPYVKGSEGHESCEPMGFDVAGDYMFVPYTGASKDVNIKTGHVEIYRTDNAKAVGWMKPDPETVGEIGLQDIRECLSAHQLKSGEYVVFLEDDYKAKVVMFRIQLP